MLKVKNLTCGYNNKLILKDIEFELKNREIVGIIGPNGSGKTTLSRAITKVIKIKNGQIFFENKDINEISIGELAKKIAVVSQAYEVESNITVEEVVLLGRIPFRHKLQFFDTKTDEDIAYKAMVLTDTLQLSKRFINELSGGERQLVFIASALAQEPKLLILDEPVAYLDIAHQVKIMDLIRKLNRENTLAVMIVLHNLNLASEYCDRLILLNAGCIHKIGSPEEVLTYQIIEEVYKTIVIVKENPISLKPYVFLVSEQEKNINAPK